MNIIKFRGLNQIGSNVIQNCCKKFSYKYELTKDAQGEHVEVAAEAPAAEPAVRYSINPGRTAPMQANVMKVDEMRASARAAIEQQHLQPSMLPQFFPKTIDKTVLANRPEMTEGDIGSGQNRRFQVSKTYANAILPLKMVKLANPFPDPVKMMSSRTISDAEKSEQMLVEARSQRQWNESQQRGQISQMMQNRNFSTSSTMLKSVGKNDKKCKIKGKGKPSCPKLKLHNCPPRARVKCERTPRDTLCKKQEAPYPAYSEFCHEDPDERPSECKLCPWKPEENPNFKPPKKDFHTSSFFWQRRGLIKDDDDEMASSSAFVDEAFVDEAASATEAEGMLCDLRKKPCERPDNRRCPHTKEKKKPKKKKSKKPSKKCSEEDQALLNNNEIFEFNLDEIVPEKEVVVDEMGTGDEGMQLKKKDKKSKKGKKDKCKKEKDTCKIQKFPFPGCPEPKVERVGGGLACPKKKKKPLVKDCPGKRCAPPSSSVEQILEMKSSKGKGKKKCPDVDLTKIPLVPPCRKKPKNNSQTCPDDLLDRYKRKPLKPRKGAEGATQESPKPGM